MIVARTRVGMVGDNSGYESPLSHNSRHLSEKRDACGRSVMEPHTLDMVSGQFLNRPSGIWASYT